MKLTAICISAAISMASLQRAAPLRAEVFGAAPDHATEESRGISMLPRGFTGEQLRIRVADSGATEGARNGSNGFFGHLSLNKQLTAGLVLKAIVQQCSLRVDNDILANLDRKITHLTDIVNDSDVEKGDIDRIVRSTVATKLQNESGYCFYSQFNIGRLIEQYDLQAIDLGVGNLLDVESADGWSSFPNLCSAMMSVKQEAQRLVSFSFEESQIGIVFMDAGWHWEAGQHVAATIMVDGISVSTMDIEAKNAGRYFYVIVPKMQFASLMHAQTLSVALAAPYTQDLTFDIRGLEEAARRLGECVVSKGYFPDR